MLNTKHSHCHNTPPSLNRMERKQKQYLYLISRHEHQLKLAYDYELISGPLDSSGFLMWVIVTWLPRSQLHQLNVKANNTDM